jgi:small-conductance mechanosensitive channel
VLVALVVLLLAPFGESPGELLMRSARILAGLRVGELELRPIGLLQAVVVLTLALTALTLLKRWLAERFLPTTGLDAGMRTSLVTLFAFIGSVVAVALALSALGLALEKVAWIASALSVGIGFGLQAVVSNFVSGLILLAERPVRVGDRVSLGGAEGDIRRINVRATEIQLDDRSTLIVPNSEFITKVVRNLTHDHAPGLVLLRLPLPLSSDVGQVRARLLAALEQHEDILKDPPPAVQIEGIDADRLVFVATGFVAVPRKVQAIKSALLARVLPELQQTPPA